MAIILHYRALRAVSVLEALRRRQSAFRPRSQPVIEGGREPGLAVRAEKAPLAMLPSAQRRCGLPRLAPP